MVLLATHITRGLSCQSMTKPETAAPEIKRLVMKHLLLYILLYLTLLNFLLNFVYTRVIFILWMFIMMRFESPYFSFRVGYSVAVVTFLQECNCSSFHISFSCLILSYILIIVQGLFLYSIPEGQKKLCLTMSSIRLALAWFAKVNKMWESIMITKSGVRLQWLS